MSAKILVVDDSLTIQKVIKLALSNEQYEIHGVFDGKEGLEQLSVFRPDLVFIDATLPDQTAFEFKQKADEDQNFSGIKFVVLSSAFENMEDQKVLSAGFSAQLVKPFDPAHLRKLIQEVLQSSAPKVSEKKSDKPPAPPSAPQAISLEDASSATAMAIELESPGEIKTDSPPPPPKQEQEVDEIQKLTQETMELSLGGSPLPGHDDLDEWSISENSKNEPSPTLEIDLPRFQEEDSHEISFDIKSPDQLFQKISEEKKASPESSSLLPSNPPATPKVRDLMPEEIEGKIAELVEKRVKEELSRMSKTLLPDLAERLLKEEIHKLLSEKN